jgi:hypothetical protein
MRKNSAQTAQIVDFIYAKVDNANDNVVLIGAGSAHNITNGEVQLLDPHSGTGDFLQTADAANYEDIQIVQGTPNSGALYNVDPFGTGYPDVERSGILKKGKVLSVAKYAFALPTYQSTLLDFTDATVLNYTAANNYPIYQSVFTMQSVRGDIVYGMNKEVFSISYQPPTSSASAGAFIKHFVTEANKFSSVVGSVTETGGTKPFMVLALEPTTTVADSIGRLRVGDTFTFAQYNGVNVTYKVDEQLFNTFAKAITATDTITDNELHKIALNDADPPVLAFVSGYKIVNANTATFSGNELILIVSLDETPLLAFDDIIEVKTRIDVGVNDLAYTKTELVKPFEGTGLGRQVLLWYRQKAKLQKFNMQNHPIHGEFFINQDLPEYFTTTGKYSLTVIDYFDTVDTINGTSVHPKQVVIVHDAAVAELSTSNKYIRDIVSAAVVTGYGVTTTATANFEDQLSAWITDSNDDYKAIKFLGTATKSNTTFG